MLSYNSEGKLIIDDENEFIKKFNSCKVKHYSKLNPEELEGVHKLFNETPRYIIGQLQCVFWKYYERNELEKFKNEFVMKVKEMKQKNRFLTFNKIVQRLTKTL